MLPSWSWWWDWGQWLRKAGWVSGLYHEVVRDLRDSVTVGDLATSHPPPQPPLSRPLSQQGWANLNKTNISCHEGDFILSHHNWGGCWGWAGAGGGGGYCLSLAATCNPGGLCYVMFPSFGQSHHLTDLCRARWPRQNTQIIYCRITELFILGGREGGGRRAGCFTLHNQSSPSLGLYLRVRNVVTSLRASLSLMVWSHWLTRLHQAGHQ